MNDKNKNDEATLLFRKEAIRSASSRLGNPVRAIGVSNWVLTVLLAGLIIGAGIFLASAKYARKESVIGFLEPSAGALRVVATKPGVISSVHVLEGESVGKGQPILTLAIDPTTESGAHLGQLLTADADLQSKAIDDQTVAHRLSVSHQDQELLAKRKGLILREQRDELDGAIQRERLTLQEASLVSFKDLNRRHIVSDLQYRDRIDAVLQAKQAISSTEKDNEDAMSSIAEIDAERAKIKADLGEIEAQERSLAAQVAEKRASVSADSEIVLTSPEAGRVVALEAKLGQPVATSTALAIILPTGAKLEAELWIPSRAAGFVRVGDKVRLLYDAFPYQRFGVGHGRVTAIASAPTMPSELPNSLETKEPLYRVRVILDRQDVEGYGRRWSLVPGMRLNADLILDQRSLLEWLLDPLYAASRRGGG